MTLYVVLRGFILGVGIGTGATLALSLTLALLGAFWR